MKLCEEIIYQLSAGINITGLEKYLELQVGCPKRKNCVPKGTLSDCYASQFHCNEENNSLPSFQSILQFLQPLSFNKCNQVIL